MSFIRYSKIYSATAVVEEEFGTLGRLEQISVLYTYFRVLLFCIELSVGCGKITLIGPI